MICFLDCSHGSLDLANTVFEIEEAVPAKQCCVSRRRRREYLQYIVTADAYGLRCSVVIEAALMTSYCNSTRLYIRVHISMCVSVNKRHEFITHRSISAFLIC